MVSLLVSLNSQRVQRDGAHQHDNTWRHPVHGHCCAQAGRAVPGMCASIVMMRNECQFVECFTVMILHPCALTQLMFDNDTALAAITPTDLASVGWLLYPLFPSRCRLQAHQRMYCCVHAVQLSSSLFVTLVSRLFDKAISTSVNVTTHVNATSPSPSPSA